MNVQQERFERYANMLQHFTKEYERHVHWTWVNECVNAMREAAQGHARYEALRTMNPKEFAELWAQSLLGKLFDELVDGLVKAKNEPYRGYPLYGDWLVEGNIKMDSK